MQFERKIKTNDCGELPADLHLFLKPKDPKSVTLGNTLSNQRLSWLACEDKLAFINNADNDVWIKIDLSDYFPESCMITCGEEVTLPGSDSGLLLLGCETNLGGLLLFFQPFLRRMIRVVEIDVGVSSIGIVDLGNWENPLLPGILSNMNGIVSLGGIDGSLILLDLRYTLLKKAMKGEVDWRSNNWAWPSVINKIQYISRHTDTWESIQRKIDHCHETNDSLAFLLNDNEGELIAPKHGQLYSGVTCLHYSSIAAALFVGYEVGVWQMWSIPEVELLYTSKWEMGQGVSVVGLSVMEPCDDPRHYLYIWVGHSRPARPAYIHRNPMLTASSPPNSPGPLLFPPLPPACQEPPFSLIYSLAFSNKCNIDSYGVLYSDFYKCDESFEMEMVNELDNFVSGRILSVNSLICVNPHRKYETNREEEKEMLRVWCIVWECEFEEVDDKIVYVTLFDLNQWYNKTPGRPEITRPVTEFLPIPDTPFFATWYLPPYNQNDTTLAVRLDPKSLEANRFLNQLDVHYYPSNISYYCTKVGTMRICQGEGLSVLSEMKNRLEIQPVYAMTLPEPLMHACISIGLLPNFDDTASIHSITINSDVARRYLLTICIENGLRDVVLACARHWFDSACTDTSISLDFLVDFLWDLFTTYKRKIDELSVCLFDCSGNELNFLSSIRIGQLNEYMKVIKTIYNVLIKDYSTFKKIYIVKHRYMAIEIKTFYLDIIIWFISQNLLPEQSFDFIPATSFPYNYVVLRKHVAVRRVKSQLLIDEMIKRWISQEVEEWGHDGSAAYPPPSIQSIIRLSLIAGLNPSIKHFFILYFLQDFLDCLSNNKCSVDPQKIIQNYRAHFGVREGLMRIIIAYRDIDCKNFKDGVEMLLDKSVKNCDLEEWEHRHIIMELHKHKEYNLAFYYLKGMKPPLGTTDDIKMEISLNVALGNVSSGYFITHQRNQRHPVLLKHFFQECVNMSQIKHVYPLPLDKYEENCFLDFLRSSNLNVANDLILYFYINRHRYAEAFVHYEKMKRSGEVGGQDSNSRKRDMIMKTLESRFDPKLLLLQRSVWEAKNMPPPSGFYEEKWKPTSSYLKFDDSDPKKPLLKSSIKELAYITVWQGQKLAKMREKAYTVMNQREENHSEDSVPLIERIKAAERSDLGGFNKKRLRAEAELGGIMKKVKLIEETKGVPEIIVSEACTPPKRTLDYSIIQEMVSTPRVEQNKTPHRQTLTPGPTSILRVKSGKKEDVSSCDESSSTPRKTLKFTLPLNSDKKDDGVSLSFSRPLNLEEISDDEVSIESLNEDNKPEHVKLENLVQPKPYAQNVVGISEEEDGLISEEESLLGSEKIVEDGSTGNEESAPSMDSVEAKTSERDVSLEDRLQQIKTQNRKLNSFMEGILSSKHIEEPIQERNTFTRDVECTFMSNQSSEVDDDSGNKGLHLDDRRDPSTHDDNEWQVGIESVEQGHYELGDKDSSTSDSLDKVYTTMGSPEQKISTIFEVECETEEPGNIENDHVIAGTIADENKDSYVALDKGNYQESDLGDEKLDQECDYMQFSHQDNFSEHYDSESENNNDEDEEINQADFAQEEKANSLKGKDKSDSEDDVICLDSDSERETQSKSAGMTGRATTYTDSERGDSLSSFSKSQGYSEEEFDERYEEDSYEDYYIEEEEVYGEEEEDNGESDIEELTDNDIPNYHNTDSSHSGNDQNSELSIDLECEPSSNQLAKDFSRANEGESVDVCRVDITCPLDSHRKEVGSVPPLDASLLEKIVSFSKTVSDEQLKGLADVVKTSINTTKSDYEEHKRESKSTSPVKTLPSPQLLEQKEEADTKISSNREESEVPVLSSKVFSDDSQVTTKILDQEEKILETKCSSESSTTGKSDSSEIPCKNICKEESVENVPLKHDKSFTIEGEKTSDITNSSKSVTGGNTTFFEVSSDDHSQSKPCVLDTVQHKNITESEIMLKPISEDNDNVKCEDTIFLDSDEDDPKCTSQIPSETVEELNVKAVSSCRSLDEGHNILEAVKLLPVSENVSILHPSCNNHLNEKLVILDAVELQPIEANDKRIHTHSQSLETHVQTALGSGAEVKEKSIINSQEQETLQPNFEVTSDLSSDISVKHGVSESSKKLIVEHSESPGLRIQEVSSCDILKVSSEENCVPEVGTVSSDADSKETSSVINISDDKKIADFSDSCDQAENKDSVVGETCIAKELCTHLETDKQQPTKSDDIAVVNETYVITASQNSPQIQKPEVSTEIPHLENESKSDGVHCTNVMDKKSDEVIDHISESCDQDVKVSALGETHFVDEPCTTLETVVQLTPCDDSNQTYVVPDSQTSLTKQEPDVSVEITHLEKESKFDGVQFTSIMDIKGDEIIQDISDSCDQGVTKVSVAGETHFAEQPCAPSETVHESTPTPSDETFVISVSPNSQHTQEPNVSMEIPRLEKESKFDEDHCTSVMNKKDDEVIEGISKADSCDLGANKVSVAGETHFAEQPCAPSETVHEPTPTPSEETFVISVSPNSQHTQEPNVSMEIPRLEKESKFHEDHCTSVMNKKDDEVIEDISKADSCDQGAIKVSVAGETYSVEKPCTSSETVQQSTSSGDSVIVNKACDVPVSPNSQQLQEPNVSVKIPHLANEFISHKDYCSKEDMLEKPKPQLIVSQDHSIPESPKKETDNDVESLKREKTDISEEVKSTTYENINPVSFSSCTLQSQQEPSLYDEKMVLVEDGEDNFNTSSLQEKPNQQIVVSDKNYSIVTLSSEEEDTGSTNPAKEGGSEPSKEFTCGDNDAIQIVSKDKTDILMELPNTSKNVSESSLTSKEDTVVDSSNEHVTTIIAGNKTFCKSELIVTSSISKKLLQNEAAKETVKHIDKTLSPADNSSSVLVVSDTHNDTSLFNTAICEDHFNSSEVDKSNLTGDISELNTAMVLNDGSSTVELNTPHSKKIPHTEKSSEAMHDANRIFLDSNVSIAFEVSKSVKKKKAHKNVKMVDKCVMTDKRRLSKKQSKTSEALSTETEKEVLAIKKDTEFNPEYGRLKHNVHVVDRSMMTDMSDNKAIVDEGVKDTDTPRRSRRRSSSLQPDFKINIEDMPSTKSYSTSVESINKLSNQTKSPKDNVSDSHVRSDQNVEIGSVLSKPARNIRKGIRRSLKSAYSENDITCIKLPESDRMDFEGSTVNMNSEGISTGSKHYSKTDEANPSDDKRERKVRKIVRRKSSIARHENTQLEKIPEDKALVYEDNNPNSNSRIARHSRSSSVPNILAIDDKCSFSLETDKSGQSGSLNNVPTKYASNEEMSIMSVSPEGTPRRSCRFSKPVDNSSFSPNTSKVNSHREPTDKQFRKYDGRKIDYSEDSYQDSTHSRRIGRRSKLSRMSTLADIVELPESEVEKSISSTMDRLHDSEQHFHRSHTKGFWEANSKTDLSLLAMQQAKNTTRKRTHSSSSEPHLSSETNSHYDIPVHWLRSSTRSENSESTVESINSHSIKSISHKPMGEDVLKVPTHRRRSQHFIKSRRSCVTKSQTVDASADESDAEAPPFSPLTIESSPGSPQSQVDTEEKHIKVKRVNKRHSTAAAETEKVPLEPIKPARGRRRTLSSSSEPPLTVEFSPPKTNYTSLHPVEKQKKKKSFVDLTKHLTGADVLSMGCVGRRSRSLHDGNKILPFKQSKKEQNYHQDNVDSQPSTSLLVSPQLATYSENRRLTRHQRSLIERSLENTPNTPESITPVTTPKRRRRSSVVAGSEDEATTPIRSSKRLQEKAHKLDP